MYAKLSMGGKRPQCPGNIFVDKASERLSDILACKKRRTEREAKASVPDI